MTSFSRGRPPVAAVAGVVAVVLTAALTVVPNAGAAARAGGDGPRLTVSRLDPPPAVVAGAALTVRGEVANRGRGDLPGGSKVRVELRDATSTIPLGRVRLKRMRSGGHRAFVVTATMPAALDVGHSFSLVACVHRRGRTGRLVCESAPGQVSVAPPILVSGSAPPPVSAASSFTPGARSLDDPYFPQIGNGGYDALHYAIDLDYDPATNTFAGGTSTTVTVQATQNLSELSFDFQRALTVSAVTVDGSPATSFEQVDATPQIAPDAPGGTQPAKLVVTPAVGLSSGSTHDIEISYSGTPQQIQDADESFEGWVRSCRLPQFTPPCDGAYTVNEPIGAQSWFPSNDVPSDKATIETVITVPTTHVALGTGELEDRTSHGDGTWTWHWAEDDPTAPYLATGTVGRFDYASSTSFSENISGRNIAIYTAIDSAKNSTAKNTFTTNTAAIPAVMNYLAGNFGPYPFDSTGAVSDIAPDVGYALENQTKPHYASGFASNGVGFSATTQVHELSHQWFGDSVSPATWGQIWFSEGWATYIENAYRAGPPASEDTAGLRDFFDDVYAVPDDPAAGDAEWTLPPAELGGAGSGPVNLFDGFSVYDRPGAMMIGLRFILGEETFYDFARGLQDTYRHATITEGAFVRAAEDASGFAGADLQRLDDYLNQWLHAGTRPTLTPDDFGP